MLVPLPETCAPGADHSTGPLYALPSLILTVAVTVADCPTSSREAFADTDIPLTSTGFAFSKTVIVVLAETPFTVTVTVWLPVDCAEKRAVLPDPSAPDQL